MGQVVSEAEETRAIFEDVLAEQLANQVIPLLDQHTRDIASLSGDVAELKDDVAHVKDDVAELMAAEPEQDERIEQNTRDITSLKDDIAAIPARTTLLIQPSITALMRDEWTRLWDASGLAEAQNLNATLQSVQTGLGEMRAEVAEARKDIAPWKARQERWNITRRVASVTGDRVADLTEIAAFWGKRLAVLYAAYEVVQRMGVL